MLVFTKLNLARANTYVDLLWDKNVVRSLKRTAEVVQANKNVLIPRTSTRSMGSQLGPVRLVDKPWLKVPLADLLW
jgi:hypothetical protein